MTAYYNEIDPYAAQWLRNLIEAGRSDSVLDLLFYLTFGVDVLSAKALGAKEANELKERIESCEK